MLDESKKLAARYLLEKQGEHFASSTWDWNRPTSVLVKAINAIQDLEELNAALESRPKVLNTRVSDRLEEKASELRAWPHSHKKTAGEVRHIKDKESDKGAWGWGGNPPSTRESLGNFEFKPENLEPLTKTLRSALAAMGHVLRAYNTFTRLKSVAISPDGSLGGKGYIAKIADIRKQFMNCVEALSAISDTLYDEVNAPHWNPESLDMDPRERKEIKDLKKDVALIRNDPEEWAQKEETEMDEEGAVGATGKTASFAHTQLAFRYLARRSS